MRCRRREQMCRRSCKTAVERGGGEQGAECRPERLPRRRKDGTADLYSRHEKAEQPQKPPVLYHKADEISPPFSTRMHVRHSVSHDLFYMYETREGIMPVLPFSLEVDTHDTADRRRSEHHGEFYPRVCRLHVAQQREAARDHQQ